MSADHSNTTLTVRIMGRDYSVACPEGERKSLIDSAEYLSGRMRAVQSQGKIQSADRIAIMAALNISHDLLALKRQIASQQAETAVHEDKDMAKRLTQLQLRIQSALNEGEQSPAEKTGQQP